MLRRVGYLSTAMLSVAASTLLAGGPRPAASGQPQLGGSARLTGRVVAADNRRPVRRAHVTLAGLPASQQNAGPNRVYVSRTIETDVNGRFDFTDLPAGSYSINVDPVSGFVRLVRPRGTTLTEGQTRQVIIRLERAGAIEGRVQDESGDGVLGAQVQAVRRLDFGGHVTLSTAGASATTDDLGRFRLFNLPAGEYYVVASRTSPQRHIDAPPRSGYANTYYPGSPVLRGARPVAVRAGRDTDRVNFTLAACRLANISVHPVSSVGVPLGREAQLTLTRRDDVYLASSTRYASRREDGAFVFGGVPPGDYYLVVTTSARMEEAAYVNVTIADDVSLNVQTNTGARVSGRVIVDGRPAGDEAGSAPANVWVTATPPVGTYGPVYARVPLAHVRATDRFELTGLRGPMVFSAEVALGALLSIRRAGEEIAGKPLDFAGTEAIDDIDIELTTKVAQLDVTVTGARARDEPEPVVVILFPQDPSLWHHGYVQYARTTAFHRLTPQSDSAHDAASFEFQIARLIRVPPGRYLIVAIHDSDLRDPAAAGVLEMIRPLAMPITLVAGQTGNVTLPVVRVGR